MSQLLSYENWLKAIDLILENRYDGASHDDLPDWDYAGAYSKGMTPSEAARKVATVVF
jgi:hypothetical protein